MKIMKTWVILFLTALLFGCGRESPLPADVVFVNGLVYTVNDAQPWAQAVAVRGERIVAVLDDGATAKAYIGANTRVIDLNGRLLVPGFVYGHVHFNRAGALLLGANLLKVADDEALRAEISRAVSGLEPGEWITGGMWGA